MPSHREVIKALRDQIQNMKVGFMDPAMAAGAPPAGMGMDPSMMGGAPPAPGMPPGAPPMAPPGAPPMAPPGAPPMDPAAMGGAPPMDPAMMGGAPPAAAPPADPAAAAAGAGITKEDLRQVMMEVMGGAGAGAGGAPGGAGGAAKPKKMNVEETLMKLQANQDKLMRLQIYFLKQMDMSVDPELLLDTSPSEGEEQAPGMPQAQAAAQPEGGAPSPQEMNPGVSKPIEEIQGMFPSAKAAKQTDFGAPMGSGSNRSGMDFETAMQPLVRPADNRQKVSEVRTLLDSLRRLNRN